MKVISRDGTQRELGVNAFHAIDQGDTFEIVSQGGGGFGDPLERDPDHVLQDVIDGLVSEGAALADYGVAIAGADGDRKINLQATQQTLAAESRGAKIGVNTIAINLRGPSFSKRGGAMG